MADKTVELDPRVQGILKWGKAVGVVVVAFAASAFVAIGSLSVIAAGALALGALVMVNFVVPVGARYIALKRQQSLTKLAEEFSEETIREDERKEEGRLETQKAQYATQSAEFKNIIDELSANLAEATDDEQVIIKNQISELNDQLLDAESAIKKKVDDLVDLKRLNRLYVSLHRAGKAMKRSQEQHRNAEEIQRVETARNAIKTRMREAHAGQKLEAMSSPLRDRLSGTSVAQIAQLGHSKPMTIQTITEVKEVEHVPARR
jgi:esterase/lipase